MKPVIAVLLSLALAAPALARDERGCGILPPTESPDPPGFNSANNDIDKKGAIVPYYSPLIPVSQRWGYKELIPYYPGYCRNGRHGANRCPGLGCAAGIPGGALDGAEGTSLGYGAFSGSPDNDDARFWRMGGNGLVPYGAPPPPRPGPDLIDLIEARRNQASPGCPPAP